MNRERPVLLNRSMRLMVTDDLSRAVHNAATRAVMSSSEYCRRAIVERLRKDRVPIAERENQSAA
jgi:hypothetical protein